MNRCVFCGDVVTYHQTVKDSYCATCGLWQNEGVTALLRAIRMVAHELEDMSPWTDVSITDHGAGVLRGRLKDNETTYDWKLERGRLYFNDDHIDVPAFIVKEFSPIFGKWS